MTALIWHGCQDYPRKTGAIIYWQSGGVRFTCLPWKTLLWSLALQGWKEYLQSWNRFSSNRTRETSLSHDCHSPRRRSCRVGHPGTRTSQQRRTKWMCGTEKCIVQNEETSKTAEMLWDEPEWQGDRHDFKAWRESKQKAEGPSWEPVKEWHVRKSSRRDTHPLGAFGKEPCVPWHTTPWLFSKLLLTLKTVGK